MIIDCHTHVYPDKIARKASDSIGDFYGIPMNHDGSVAGLLETADRAGIDKCLICSAAVDGGHVRKVNDFIISVIKEYPDRLYGFGTLHPDMENIGEEVDYMLANGLMGVKLHPDMQRFALNEIRTEAIYAACEGVCPILIHTGDRRFHYSNPHMIPPILKRHPGLILECAHFGGYSEWDEAIECLTDTNVYVDTSSTFFALPDERLYELFSRFDPDHILFGSDYPMWDAESELKRLKALRLPEPFMEKLLYRNTLTMLGLSD